MILKANPFTIMYQLSYHKTFILDIAFPNLSIDA